ncbi:TfuA-like protein [Methanococcus voltae]|uniref:TfuA domain protein core n=1 Tax=Methanococcus voltae (strain ATCC BAA-1334 / A3) TaxID=456320 RepID=D7DT47_METV3|nr:TfuA-like protein [Methanococcus voltae]MCS3901837.1 hypothetical protein [Methanococcus voltae]
MENLKIAIFSKLTLKEKEIKNLFEESNLNNYELTIYDPIKRGDLQKPEMLNYDVIGIIDGCFLQNTAVGHREILNILKNNVKVYGAGSMGALRASELDTLGMMGVGKVYELYKSGKLCDDDEVAVTFDKKTENGEIVQITFSMVSFREIMKNALAENIINQKDYKLIINSAKELYYPLRTYETVFDKSKLDKEIQIKIMDYINTQRDIKHIDGCNMIKKIISDNSTF